MAAVGAGFASPGARRVGHPSPATSSTSLESNRDQLVGEVQERYGYASDEAEREVDEAISRW